MRKVLVSFLLLASVASAQTTPDFKAATDEAVRYLSDLIKINTTQPDGNELKAAEYLKQICDREGITSRIYESAPGRGNFVARIKGNGTQRPVMLMAHLDTVGVEPQLWTVDPFGGLVKDGMVWGRGAQDDKQLVAAELVALLLLARNGVPLQRDVILLAEADEEESKGLGIQWMLDHHPEAIDAEFSVTEGGMAALDANGKLRYMGIQVGEKTPVNLTLVAKGNPGHASIPRLDNPVVHLARAVAIAADYDTTVRMNDISRRFFAAMAQASTGAEKQTYEALLKTTNDAALKRLAREVQKYNLKFASLLHTSISPTIFNGGFQNNVIPGTAEANLNIRLLAPDGPEDVIAQLEKAIHDPAITITAKKMTRQHQAPSSPDTAFFHGFEKALAAMSPGTPIAPTMSTWATDSSQLRAKGVQAYGVIWPLTPEEEATFHGNDERVRISSLGFGVEFLYRTLMTIAASH